MPEQEQNPDESYVEPILGGNGGYYVKCEICGQKIWISKYDENFVYVCDVCSETLPE